MTLPGPVMSVTVGNERGRGEVTARFVPFAVLAPAYPHVALLDGAGAVLGGPCMPRQGPVDQV